MINAPLASHALAAAMEVAKSSSHEACESCRIALLGRKAYLFFLCGSQHRPKSVQDLDLRSSRRTGSVLELPRSSTHPEFCEDVVRAFALECTRNRGFKDGEFNPCLRTAALIPPS